ncbi:MAG: proteasome-activating nucleotidase [Candidatus Lokiarchaeota archaeon]|nr:proteasome-activating nucleotidase [Candidatus Lokiarchaeota archaeon]MBD3201753.1 proteasome-activating nucleotidase [Candidatus Lokiarchaeota archaeon]
MDSSLNDEKKKRDDENGEYLITYISHLEKRIHNLETERELLDAERLRLERELNTLKNEVEGLKQPPLLTATVTDIIEDKRQRVIVKTSNGPSYLVHASKKILDSDLIPGSEVALNQHTYAIMSILPMNLEPFVKGMEISENIPNVSYEDIGGLEEQIQEVRELVELPLKNPDIFKKIGITPPRGILFHGPPGTGKTLLAKAVAHETNTTYIRVIGSELVQKFIGEGARYVREIFNLARQKAPAILLIDELDAIGAERMADSTSGDREVQRTLMQLLSELDGFSERGDVKFIGATNRVDILDSALLRPGRFDRIIEFPIPNEQARQEIFKIHIHNLNIKDDVLIDKLVNLTNNSTGADIKAICTEAGMFAIRRNSEIIEQKDFLNGINKVLNSTKFNKACADIFT